MYCYRVLPIDILSSLSDATIEILDSKRRVLGKSIVATSTLLSKHSIYNGDGTMAQPVTVSVIRDKSTQVFSVQLTCEAYGSQHMLSLLKSQNTALSILNDLESLINSKSSTKNPKTNFEENFSPQTSKFFCR